MTLISFCNRAKGAVQAFGAVTEVVLIKISPFQGPDGSCLPHHSARIMSAAASNLLCIPFTTFLLLYC